MSVSSQATQLLVKNPGPFMANCPTRVVLDHVTSRWGVLVIAALAAETHRWGELRRKIDGISEKMLAQTLKTLEHDGFVYRAAQPVIPPHVEYSLTDRGHELSALLIPLLEWVAGRADDILGVNESGKSEAVSEVNE